MKELSSSLQDTCRESVDDHIEKQYFMGKDGITRWDVQPPPQTQHRHHNVFSETPGPKRPAKLCQTPLQCWELYFPDRIINRLVEFTNCKLEIIKAKYVRDRDCPPTDAMELRAVFDLLYLSGSMKMSHVQVNDLWADDGIAPEFFRATMRSNRFLLLLRALRISEASYTAGECVTIDEMMMAFRGRCSFLQYLPSKPDPYGLKSFAVVDAKTYYTIKMEIYAGKQPPGPYQVDNSAASVVQRISEPIVNAGRNITMDNYFTSMKVVDSLREDARTSVVGTLKRNKREIPPVFIDTKKQVLYSSKIGHSNGKVLVSYKAKKNKTVLMISSMHDTCHIDPATGNRMKPDVIMYYNSTKAGVDIVDKMKASYNFTIARFSCRWPLTVFFHLLNIAGINGYVIHSANKQEKMRRADFLKVLAKNLIKPHMERRLKIKTLPTVLRNSMEKCLGRTGSKGAEQEDSTGKSERCHFCPSRKNRKTQSKCYNCEFSICGEHTKKLCRACYDKYNGYDDY
ncbi:piggyBac transposable element-derived protein 4-like [Diachasma alloeum]|uniref:piggyBac transposable element-derived protein 4-like n=1 Tax=Diachasma alloeum TaxID=454923 RepID=UPI0007381656|nr:piggyBac transposable element-derived protein 4-like [Diachasma alloeum]